MSSATAFQFLILVISVALVIFRLFIGWLTSMGSTRPFDPHNQRNRPEEHRTQACQNRDGSIMGSWSQHRQAVLYGWGQGVTIRSRA